VEALQPSARAQAVIRIPDRDSMISILKL